MDWSLLHVFEKSDGSEVITQSEVVWFFGYCGFSALAASVVASLLKPMKTKAWIHTFWTLICLLVVVSQYYQLALVSVLLTPDLEASTILKSCRESTKGGKLHNSFRDCREGQGATCSRDNPCQPCDTPVPAHAFDGALWESSCQVCSPAFPGNCHFDSSTGPFCRGANGLTEPCNRCCLAASLGSSKVIESLALENCASVYDASQLGWNRTGAYACADQDFPVPTRFGCCPESASPPPAESLQPDQSTEEVDYGTFADVIAGVVREGSCIYRGPRGASWGFCAYTVDDARYLGLQGIRGTSQQVDQIADAWKYRDGNEHVLGCPVLENGKLVEFFCRPPVLVNTTALLP